MAIFQQNHNILWHTLDRGTPDCIFLSTVRKRNSFKIEGEEYMPWENDRLNTVFDGFQKRSGLVVPFSWQKIELAIDRAVDEVSRKHSISKNEGLSSKVAGQVLQQLSNPNSEFYVHPEESGKRIPRIEDVQATACGASSC